MSKWCDIFLGDTFVGGSTPSIADYKAASFLVVAVHPALKEMCPTWEPPARVRTFMDDFQNKVCCASIMHSGFGSNSICEFIHKKSLANKAKKAAAYGSMPMGPIRAHYSAHSGGVLTASSLAAGLGL